MGRIVIGVRNLQSLQSPIAWIDERYRLAIPELGHCRVHGVDSIWKRHMAGADYSCHVSKREE